MAETASRSRPARSARDSGRDSGLGSLRVSYYRRMKPQHVYPWTVTLPGGRRSAEQEVTVRLLIAGAQVVPAEQALQSADGQSKATFFVTPIAKGWLKGQRLEVLVGGRKVQEIPLASKVVSQRRTLILLLLTFLVPWLVWSCFHFPLLDYQPESLVNNKFVPAHFVDITKKNSKASEEMIAYVKDVVGPPEEVKEFLPKQAIDILEKDTPKYSVFFYQEFCQTIRDYKVGFFAGVGLLLLTLASWFFSRQKSKTLVSAPIPLPAGARGDEEE